MLNRTGRRGRLIVAAFVAAIGIGLAGTAVAAVEQSSVARQAHIEAAAPGTPCSVSARACVDLDTQRAWLIRDGEVTLARCRSPPAEPGRRRLSGTRSGCTARAGTM